MSSYAINEKSNQQAHTKQASNLKGDLGNKGNKKSSNNNLTVVQSSPTPWKNQDGSPKSDEDIKAICGDSLERWDDYLAQTVDCELDRNEVVLGNPLEIEEAFSERKQVGALLAFLNQEESHQKGQIIKQLIIQNLSRRERQVVQLVFFENKSQREVAKLLNISRMAVRTFESRAIIKIRNLSGIKKELSVIENYYSILKEKASEDISCIMSAL